MGLKMHDLDQSYQEAFVDAWANRTGVEPHEAGLLSVFLLGTVVTEAHGNNPDSVDVDIERLIETMSPVTGGLRT